MNGEHENMTMKDIALLAGVSSATVSYVLSDKKGVKISDSIRQKIIEICRQYDYTPNSSKNRAGKNSEKRNITISDIAREAGVSTAMVSYIVNDRQDVKIAPETRKKVLQICNLRQYRPSPIAQTLAGSKSSIIGICCNESNMRPIRNLQNFKIIKELQLALQNNNYSTLLLPPLDGNPVIQKNLDGVICIDLTEQQFYNLKENYFIPIVAIDMTVADTLFFKTYNDFRAIASYAKELLDTDKITYVTEEYNNKPYMAKLRRALADDSLIIVQTVLDLKMHLTSRKDDSFVFDGEMLALMSLPYLNTRAAVICDDKVGITASMPQLKQILIPSFEKARAAVKMLKDAINRNETQPHSIKIAPL